MKDLKEDQGKRVLAVSKLIKELNQASYIEGIIPKFKSIKLLYNADSDGWKPADFHSRCDGKGRTLSIFRSSKDFLSAGYTSVPFTSPEKDEYK